MSATLQDSIDHARASADALSDPTDVDNSAVLAWLNHHIVFRNHHQRYVLGTERLPPAWQREILPISASQDALVLLRPLKGDHTAMAALRRALHDAAPQIAATDEAVITGLADALSTQRAWIIRDASKPVTLTRTDPAVYARLNGEGGTRVDFAYLSRWEGNQALRGYVPFSHGITAGASGMTVATGFDVGQIDARDMAALDLPATLQAKIKPFLARRFKGQTRQQVAAFVAKTAPVPVLTTEEANAADLAVHGAHLRSAIASWNTRRAKGVPEFKALPVGWQTVLFSRTFHQGDTMPAKPVSKPFYTAATAGEWAKAADALAAYAVSESWYKTRVAQEAALLRKELPPPVQQAATPARLP